jgi:hypothetical protein
MNKSKNIFFVVREPTGPYRFLIEAAKTHSENLINESLTLNVNKSTKFDFIAIFNLILITFKTNFFSKKKIMSVRYQGYNLSRYTIPEIYRNFNSYLYSFSFFYESLKCFYSNLTLLRNIIKVNKSDIKAAFIDHGMYQNGLIISVLSKKKIPIYTLGYPKGILYYVNNNKALLNYENIIQIKKIKKLNNKQIKEAKASIKKTLHKTEIIPWMSAIKFVKENKKYKEITHLIYAHSFTDGQMLYGYDGFVNMYDWLDFTINELTKNKNNKILVKAHPTFFNAKFPNKQMTYDRKLFFKIISKYESNTNIDFIKEPTKNINLLNRLNKKTIIISHHGSAILESLYLNFKCISSQATLWSPKFEVTNDWNSKISYKNFLIKDWKQLRSCKKNDLYSICYQLFCNPLSLYGKYYWQQIFSEELNISRRKIYEESAYIFYKTNIKNKKIERLVQKISKKIELVKI